MRRFLRHLVQVIVLGTCGLKCGARVSSDAQTPGPGGEAKGPHWERRLKASQIKSLPRGRYTDGGGLRWLLRITVGGRRRDVGLGPANAVSSADARNLAREYRRIARPGGDPMSSDLRRDHKTVSFGADAKTVHSTQIKTTSRNGKEAYRPMAQNH